MPTLPSEEMQIGWRPIDLVVLTLITFPNITHVAQGAFVCAIDIRAIGASVLKKCRLVTKVRIRISLNLVD
ncbi:hypothetical protein DPMN_186583 [Dreissena polymorpha]|uniref:Uncharacterized protein n=1 Tax=Dreissena polymorpha TaxID=45954 RepID=A0A9D4I8A7_DREPO|nr:hypothetical protein DPMN_186583 [Dreissena polymorpha]